MRIKFQGAPVVRIDMELYAAGMKLPETNEIYLAASKIGSHFRQCAEDLQRPLSHVHATWVKGSGFPLIGIVIKLYGILNYNRFY